VFYLKVEPLVKTGGAERPLGAKASLVYAASKELGYRSAYAQWQGKKRLISKQAQKA
jgi:hypothetical protein